MEIIHRAILALSAKKPLVARAFSSMSERFIRLPTLLLENTGKYVALNN